MSNGNECSRDIPITTRKKVFGYKILDNIFSVYTSQGIVNRIEKYEAEKNHIADADKKAEQEFKVGDWVRKKDGTSIEHEFMGYNKEYKELGKVKDLCGNLITIVLNEWEHAEPPKEEKQKIDRLNVSYSSLDETQMKINELVNAVNELRGV